MADYFALLGLTPAFDLDLAALEASYFKAQRQYHPDRFVGKPAPERQQALQTSVDVNNAYNTLKEPHSRAVYILKTHGIDVTDNKEAARPSHTLLMEIMQWREQVESAQNLEALSTLENALKGLQSEAIGHISQSFTASNWQTFAQETMRLGYFEKSNQEVAQKIKRLKLQTTQLS
jgi:molecular chaperone HscB